MAPDTLRISRSAENNKNVILQQLEKHLPLDAEVLEIASGTGQHAVHFARHLAGVTWQPTDVDLAEMTLLERLEAQGNDRVRKAKVLDVDHWPQWAFGYDAVFSANCVHIISESQVSNYVEGAAGALKQNGLMMLYGPFKYDGEFTTESNKVFDGFLRKTYPGGGIKDFDWLDELASIAGLEFLSDTAMPSNNQFLIWRRVRST